MNDDDEHHVAVEVLEPGELVLYGCVGVEDGVDKVSAQLLSELRQGRDQLLCIHPLLKTNILNIVCA